MPKFFRRFLMGLPLLVLATGCGVFGSEPKTPGRAELCGPAGMTAFEVLATQAVTECQKDKDPAECARKVDAVRAALKAYCAEPQPVTAEQSCSPRCDVV